MSEDFLNKIANHDYMEKILFLRGVYKRDYKNLEEIFQQNIINESMNQSQKQYDKIPPIFHSIEKWQKQTNLLCWYCSNKIKNIPKFTPKSIEQKSSGTCGRFIPINTEYKNKKEEYNMLVEGIFCSFNCAQAYIDENIKDRYDHINRTNMLLLLYYIFNDKKITYIKPSPSKYKMVHYGGFLSVVDYEKEVESYDYIQQKEIDENNFSSLCETFIKNLSE